MSCNVDKVKALDGVMGADVIPVENLSAKLRNRLESPFPQQGQSGDWWELARELGDVMESNNDMIIVQSTDNPLFRESETGSRQNKEIMTQFKSKLLSKG